MLEKSKKSKVFCMYLERIRERERERERESIPRKHSKSPNFFFLSRGGEGGGSYNEFVTVKLPGHP